MGTAPSIVGLQNCTYFSRQIVLKELICKQNAISDDNQRDGLNCTEVRTQNWANIHSSKGNTFSVSMNGNTRLPH